MSDDCGNLAIVDLIMVGIVKRALHSICAALGWSGKRLHSLGPYMLFVNKVIEYRYPKSLESETFVLDIETWELRIIGSSINPEAGG